MRALGARAPASTLNRIEPRRPIPPHVDKVPGTSASERVARTEPASWTFGSVMSAPPADGPEIAKTLASAGHKRLELASNATPATALSTMAGPPSEESASGRRLSDPPPQAVVDGRYRILGRLGAGAMGIVYSAEDVLLKRPVALKVIEPSLARTANALDRFVREARALARLRHDNVVQIYAFGSHEASLFFAMEYVDGASLATILDKHVASGTTLPLGKVLEILSHVARGLDAAHAMNIVHRDVKPSNIVIERVTGRPVLIDFGLARHVAGPSPHSSLTAAGTPSYMAPEQARNDATLISPQTDVYSLACMAFELLTGHPVFEGEDIHQMVLAHALNAPRLPSAIRRQYEVFDALFARALAKHPRYRHASCGELVEALASTARAAGLLEQHDARATVAARQVARGPRVLILAEDDGMRRAVVREVTRAVQRIGHSFGVECTSEPGLLVSAFEREPATVVIIDDDRTAGQSISLAGHLRSLAGGANAEVIVMTRNMLAGRDDWDAVGARRLSKPLNMRALAAALDVACATAASKTSSAD